MKETWENLKFAWLYIKDFKGMLVKYILCNILMIVISIIVPIWSARIIVALTSNNFYQLIFISIAIFIIENVRNIVNFYSRHYSQVIYREAFTKIQITLGEEILKLENKAIDNNSSGVFIQRLTNDTSLLADVFNVLNISLTNILTNLGIFGAIFLINKLVFVFLLAMTIIRFILERRRVNLYFEKDKIFREKNEKASGFIGELVRGVRDIKMLNAENSFMDELHNRVVDFNHTRYNMQNIDNKYSLFRGFTADLTDLFLICFLVVLIKNKALDVALALVIHNYASRLPSIVNYIGMLLDQIKDFNLSSARIFAIINTEEFKKEKFGLKHLKKLKGNFEFKNVSFAYEEKKILNNLSFKVNADETVAFVGKSGAGKTTIFNLLCKMYDINSGNIYLDGYDINDLDKDTIRGNITIISQNPYIFNMSIRDNLALVKENLTDREMKKACKMACLDDFINSLPDKYDTIVGEGGVNLSGGQIQRLAIARAFVQKTEIILFDEATSALDNETQSSIQNAIENMKKSYTILIIAHRLSTVVNADRLLYIDKGKIVAESTHQELLKKNAKYKKLYELELKNK